MTIYTDAEGRITAASSCNIPGQIQVDEVPTEHDLLDYRYIGGAFLYDPLPPRANTIVMTSGGV